jgi:hypothetical protein
MKAKLLTLAVMGMMTLSFMACNSEEIAPAKDITAVQATADCECEGGLTDREDPR